MKKDIKPRSLIKIEDITDDNLSTIEEEGLYQLRNIFIQKFVPGFFSLYGKLRKTMMDKDLKLLLKKIDREFDSRIEADKKIEQIKKDNRLLLLESEQMFKALELLSDETDISKPYPNEHAARINSPEKYDSVRRQNNRFAPGVHAIWGIKGKVTELQAIRFDKDKFSPEEAKDWLKKHNYKAIEFEPSSDKANTKKVEETTISDAPIGKISEDIDNNSLGEAGEGSGEEELTEKRTKVTDDSLESFSMEVKFLKEDDEQHLVYGVVYPPDEVDSQGDWMNEVEIEKMAHNYMLSSQQLKLMHKSKVYAKVVESFIAPVSYKMGKETVKKGAWIMVTKILDDAVWKKVKKGEITGYSIGGKAQVR